MHQLNIEFLSGVVVTIRAFSRISENREYCRLASNGFCLQPFAHKLPKWPKPSISPLGKYSKAAVAADNGMCSDIGRDILLKGGNAVDAAIAALFCIGVMDSHSAGIGGGHFMTIYNATTKKCHVVDARETAPLAATENMFQNKWNLSQTGWLAIGVPGEIHGYWTEYTRFGGNVPWKTIVQPTIDLLAEGFPTSEALAKALKQKEEWILHEPTMKDFINPKTGKVYTHGQQIRTRKVFLKFLKNLAEAKDPAQMFYNSSLTEKMVAEFKKNGTS
ncbi:hypothetical protein L596_008820 [Steinernema carpocapsae]|uniref:Gamma-glutamyltranspeptidase n=1 Tax=Steinernema carpocapsae TaxID=34508 RepID=A0A4U5PDN8_STECR|nr:hypothetical protein L596_008820 [Steinernema carpocapsae]